MFFRKTLLLQSALREVLFGGLIFLAFSAGSLGQPAAVSTTPAPTAPFTIQKDPQG
jgi:hypothetical protein